MSPASNDSPLIADQIEASANQILEARRSRTTLDTLVHPPPTESDAYAIQQLVTAGSNERIAGWKIGATSAFAQEFLGCEGPFSGPVFGRDIYESGASIEAAALLNPMMEPEIAVMLGAKIADDGKATAASVRSAVSDVRPSIELVGGCFPDISTCGYRTVIADRGANLGMVLGESVVGWRDIDLQSVPVSLVKNDVVVGSGVGADALGGAMHALAWLANHLAKRGLSLNVGDIITTGTIGGVAHLQAGDRGEGTHGPLGGVSLELT